LTILICSFLPIGLAGYYGLQGRQGRNLARQCDQALAANGNGHAQLIRDSGNSKDLIAPLQPLSSGTLCASQAGKGSV
jgi:hypothetical protein